MKLLKDHMKNDFWTGIGFIWLVVAWITHVIVCLKTSAWGFLVAGALLFPIAWIHGTGVWFGWF